ncbi:MAG: serine hydrolase [Pseudomonadota bacterium]
MMTTENTARIIANKLFLLFILVATSLFSSGCEGSSEKIYQIRHEFDKNIVYFPDKQWAKIASPELAGWSTIKLEEARQYSESIHSSAVIIIENGIIIAGWGEITKCYKLHSIRKSLMSAMYGIFVDQKKIHLTSTLKELHISDIGGLSQQEERATVRDLLTARSGVFHPAAYETEGMREKRPERDSHNPGSFWFYNNWDFNALVTIFNQETNEDFFIQFQDKLAKPLQMEQFRLQDTSYYYDPESSLHPAYLFRMSALDLARFGLLYLRKGKWREQQIISVDWIEQSTQKHTVINPQHPERGYGYLWWIHEEGYYASGTGGQRLFIVPKSNVVIVHQVDTDSNTRVKSKAIWTLFDKIMQSRNRNTHTTE